MLLSFFNNTDKDFALFFVGAFATTATVISFACLEIIIPLVNHPFSIF
jgi:hypothetical protein